MNTGHTILLFDDDVEAVAGLADLFRLIGWNTVTATSLEEFRVRLREGGYCLGIHDLEVPPSADSIKAHVEAGLLGVQEHRVYYPRFNDLGVHLMPLLCMSAFAKDHRNGRKARRAGVDDAVVKPLDDNDESLVDTVKRLLRESGREDHSRCAEVTKLARQAASTPPPATSASTSSVRIDVPGTDTKRDRTLVVMNGQSVDITNVAFYVLLRLVEGRMRGLECVTKEALGARKGDGFRGTSVMQAELGPYVGSVKLYQSVRGKGYALADEVVIGDVDVASLAKHSEKRVRDVAAALTKPPKAARRA